VDAESLAVKTLLYSGGTADKISMERVMADLKAALPAMRLQRRTAASVNGRSVI
jgi:hypothetical protein